MIYFKAVTPFLFFAGLFIGDSFAPAATVTLNAVNRGSFRDDGNHSATNLNTFTGFASSNSQHYRAFFVFDLASLEGTVEGATLKLELEAYHSVMGPLTFDLFDVAATATELATGYSSSDATGISIHNDLGTGNIYATKTVDGTDVGSTLNLPLSAGAQTAIQNQLSSSFAVGVSVPGPSSGGYHLRFGEDNMTVLAQLEIELTPPPITISSNPAPEPGTQVLLCCLLGLFWLKASSTNRSQSSFQK